MHPSLRIALRHFLVHDAAAGGHPLHVAGTKGALVAQGVTVLDRAGEDVGDRFDAPVRMPGEAGPVGVGAVVAEIVEEEEGIELLRLAEAEGAVELHTGALDGGLGLRNLLDGADRHRDLLFWTTNLTMPSTLKFRSRGRVTVRKKAGGPFGPPASFTSSELASAH